MNKEQMKDPIYFNVHCAITYTINRIKGSAANNYCVAEEKEVDKLTEGYFKLVREFDGATKGLAKKREEEGL